jgi:hypothetical protein
MWLPGCEGRAPYATLTCLAVGGGLLRVLGIADLPLCRLPLAYTVPSGGLLEWDMRARVTRNSLLHPRKYASIHKQIRPSRVAIGPFLRSQQTTAKAVVSAVEPLTRQSASWAYQGRNGLRSGGDDTLIWRWVNIISHRSRSLVTATVVSPTSSSARNPSAGAARRLVPSNWYPISRSL